MSFDNPFPKTAYKVYNQTFLRNVDIRMVLTGSSVDVERYWKDFKTFAQKHFRVEVTDNYVDKAFAFFTDERNETRFGFSPYEAYISWGNAGYHSFEKTMRPSLEDVWGDFLQDVLHRETVKGLSIKKIDVFPFQISTENVNVNYLLDYVFNSSEIKDLEHIKAEKQSRLTKVMKVEKYDLGNHADLSVAMGFEVKEASETDIWLDLTVDYLPVGGLDKASMIEVASGLNAIMHDAFRHVISNNILEIMEGENQ